jgi:hypothetical protein
MKISGSILGEKNVLKLFFEKDSHFYMLFYIYFYICMGILTRNPDFLRGTRHWKIIRSLENANLKNWKCRFRDSISPSSGSAYMLIEPSWPIYDNNRRCVFYINYWSVFTLIQLWYNCYYYYLLFGILIILHCWKMFCGVISLPQYYSRLSAFWRLFRRHKKRIVGLF